jgi:hypothetical protein
VEPVAKPAMVFWAGFFINRNLVKCGSPRGRIEPIDQLNSTLVEINAARGFNHIGVLKNPKINSDRLKDGDLHVKSLKRGANKRGGAIYHHPLACRSRLWMKQP